MDILANLNGLKMKRISSYADRVSVRYIKRSNDTMSFPKLMNLVMLLSFYHFVSLMVSVSARIAFYFMILCAINWNYRHIKQRLSTYIHKFPSTK